MSGMDLFDFPKVRIEKKIRLIELFAGVGSQAMALRDIGADFEHYKVIEFDKYAVASYNAIHGTDFKPTDICDVHGADLEIAEKDKYCYLLTYSFPCTDLSVAGLMKGMSKQDWQAGHSTHSGLLWEVERILGELPKECLPDILLMENVPQVHAEQNKADFDLWCEFLRKKGYQNFRKDLNARDYGIPQNRERCFMVSVLADDFVDFEFPKPIRLEKVMKDYLEKDVAEKYYINSPKARQLIEELIANGTLESKKKMITENREQRTENCSGDRFKCQSSVCNSDCQLYNGKRKPWNMQHSKHGKRCCYGNYKGIVKVDVEVAMTIMARDCHGISGGYTPSNLVMEKNIVIDIYNNKKIDGDVCGTITANGNTSSTHCGTFGIVEKEKINKVGQISSEGSQCGTVVSDEGLSPTLSAGTHGYANAHVCTEYQIRKLTEKECFRLMGFKDSDFEKARAVNSATQIYKQAGNSIVKQVLMAIFLQFNIQGLKPWNDRNEDEIKELIK